IVDRKLLKNDAFLAYRRKVVSGRPVFGAVLGPPVDQIALEGLDSDCRVTEILVAQFVEIIPANVHVDVSAPIFLDALVNDVVGRRELLDPVRAAAEGHLKRGFSDIAFLAVLVGTLPPVFRQDRKLSDNLWQFTATGTVECKSDVAVAGFF